MVNGTVAFQNLLCPGWDFSIIKAKGCFVLGLIFMSMFVLLYFTESDIDACECLPSAQGYNVSFDQRWF